MASGNAHRSKREDVLIIIGPSGSGKSSAVLELQRRNILTLTPTWTTRPRRPDEHDEVASTHRFVDETAFDEMDAAGGFLEVVQMFDLPYRYGLPIVPPTDNTVATILLRAPLITLATRHFANFVVYQVEDTLDRALERANHRRTHGERDGSRYEQFENEMRLGRSLAHRVFTNTTTLDALVESLSEAISQDFTANQLDTRSG